MTLPPSHRNDLARGGASVRVWRDSRDRLKALAALLRKGMAETFDEIVTAALEAELARSLHPSDE